MITSFFPFSSSRRLFSPTYRDTTKKFITKQNTELWSPNSMGTSTKHLRIKVSRNIAEEGTKRLWEGEDVEVCCKVVYPSNIRIYRCEISPPSLAKHETNKDNINIHVKVDGIQVLKKKKKAVIQYMVLTFPKTKCSAFRAYWKNVTFYSC